MEACAKSKAEQVKSKAAIFAKTQQLAGLRDNGNVSALHEFLQEFAASSETPVNVALMGYPNVGKSTLLNSLMEENCSDASSRPVMTKTLVEMEYNSKIQLMDSPALDAEYSAPSSELMRHSLGGTFCVDPVPAVKAVLERIHKVKVMQLFRLPMFKDHEDFLAKYAIKRSMMRKGGDPNILRAARTFLSSMGNGTVALSCLPPTYRKDDFEMPQWFKNMNTDKMMKAQKQLFVPTGEAKTNLLELSTKNISNPQGDTTEYDVAIGDMSAYVDATSSEEEEEEEQDDDSSEEEEVESEAEPEVEQPSSQRRSKRLRKN